MNLNIEHKVVLQASWLTSTLIHRVGTGTMRAVDDDGAQYTTARGLIMCHLSLTAECELCCVCLCVCAHLCTALSHLLQDDWWFPCYASCSDTSTHRSDRTRGRELSHEGPQQGARLLGPRVRRLCFDFPCKCVRACVDNWKCLFGPGVITELVQQRYLVLPLTQVNLPCLVLKSSTWRLCRPSPRTFWPHEHLNFLSYQELLLISWSDWQRLCCIK